MRRCLELLSNISAAVDRNTKMTDLMANYIMHARPGATGEATSSPTVQGATGEATSSSTVQESEDKSDEDVSEVKTRRFRARAKHPKRKDANELRLRVSRLSTNGPRYLYIITGRSSQTREENDGKNPRRRG